jgi:trehalose synthase-fused probable maltokinase
MLQQFVRSSGDGWHWVLDRLAAGLHGPTEAIAGIKQVGALTSQMHAALASRPDAPGFPSRPVTSDELAGWRNAAERQLEGAIASVEGPMRARLATIAPLIAARLDAIGTASSARVTRIHGDYHLGQLLRTERGFVVIDFEGEPARTLADRRAPASPLRDVAGMLRSLDYAAHSADATGGSGGEPATWLREARAGLLAGYGGIQPGDQPLLDAFELEKACYEVRYEANNRPDWVWLPLDALERLVLTG